MSDLSHREQLEQRLKAELDEAEQHLRSATPEEKGQARKRLLEALHNFAMLTVEGKVPLVLVPPKSAGLQ